MSDGPLNRTVNVRALTFSSAIGIVLVVVLLASRYRDDAVAQASTVPPHENLLRVIPVHQEGYYTCWAACAEMIMEFLGGERIRQCEQASVAFGLPNCCFGEGVVQPAGRGDTQWYPDFEKWGFDVDFAPSASHPRDHLTWEELTTEINQGRPFAFAWVENAPVSHLMVLVGYHETGGDKRVIYLDPLYDDEHDAIQAAFSDYDGSSGNYAHTCDYFRIRPRKFQ